jgi:hypothetical protein
VSGTIGLLAFTILLIKEFKVSRFEKSIIDLIETKTNGEYQLVIGKADFDLRSLTYLIEDIQLVRTGSSEHPGGVQSVQIPFIRANAGSFVSFFSSQRLTFREVVVAEPVVEVDSRVRERNKITLGQALVTIFPAVESILEQFDIQSLRITRGNLKVEKGDNRLIELKFIDLLVRDWNLQHRTAGRQIQLKIEDQHVALSQASFSFTEVEYKYPEHYLIFKDFIFHSFDTATSSRIDVEGKSALIRNLDYNELYTNQRYKLDKIELIEPKFSGTLHSARNSAPDREIRLPLSEILKQTFGEIQVDSAIIKNAAFRMTLAIDEDSIKAHIPLVNIVLHRFAVIADSSDIRFGELQMDLSETEISLNDNVRLVCNAILFERNEDFTISNVRLTETGNDRAFVECDRIGFKYFRLFEFLVSQELRAESIAIENANITLNPALLRLFPDFSRNGASGGSYEVELGTVSLRNVNASYSDGNHFLRVGDLSTRIDKVNDLSATSLLGKLNEVYLSAFSFSDKTRGLEARANTIHLTRSSATMKEANLTYGSLNVHADGVLAERSGSESLNSFTSWENIDMEKLVVQGEIPQTAKAVFIGGVHINDLSAAIRHKGIDVSLKASKLRGKDVYTGGALSCGNLRGHIYEATFNSPDAYVAMDSVNLDSTNESTFFNIVIQSDNRKTIIPYAQAEGITWNTDVKKLDRFMASDPAIYEDSVTTAVADSISFYGIDVTVLQRPTAESAVLYKPEFYLSPENNSALSLPGHPFVRMISAFTLHDGWISSGREHVSFRGVTTGTLDHGIRNMDCNELTYQSDRHRVTLTGLHLDKRDMRVAALSLEPSPEFYENNSLETDVMQGKWNEISVTGLLVDTLIQKRRLVADTVVMNGLTLNVKRDRRLPDPEAGEKAFSLDELLIGSGLDVSELVIRDGFIRYTEISEKTGQEGSVSFYDLNADIHVPDRGEPGLSFEADTRLYNQAPVHVRYKSLNGSTFHMQADVGEFDLASLNQALLPLQAMEIKQGHLDKFSLDVTADRDSAGGKALMTYSDLQINFFRRSEPDKKNLGNDILTFLANGIAIKNKRENAAAGILETRVKERSAFNYWNRIVTNGALNVVRRGKKIKGNRR